MNRREKKLSLEDYRERIALKDAAIEQALKKAVNQIDEYQCNPTDLIKSIFSGLYGLSFRDGLIYDRSQTPMSVQEFEQGCLFGIVNIDDSYVSISNGVFSWAGGDDPEDMGFRKWEDFLVKELDVKL